MSIKEIESLPDDKLIELSNMKTKKNIATDDALIAQDVLCERQNSCYFAKRYFE